MELLNSRVVFTEGNYLHFVYSIQAHDFFHFLDFEATSWGWQRRTWELQGMKAAEVERTEIYTNKVVGNHTARWSESGGGEWYLGPPDVSLQIDKIDLF